MRPVLHLGLVEAPPPPVPKRRYRSAYVPPDPAALALSPATIDFAAAQRWRDEVLAHFGDLVQDGVLGLIDAANRFALTVPFGDSFADVRAEAQDTANARLLEVEQELTAQKMVR